MVAHAETKGIIIVMTHFLNFTETVLSILKQDDSFLNANG